MNPNENSYLRVDTGSREYLYESNEQEYDRYGGKVEVRCDDYERNYVSPRGDWSHCNDPNYTSYTDKRSQSS